MFFNIDRLNFSVFNGHSILSGRSIANTKRVTWISLQVFILYHSYTFCGIYLNIFSTSVVQ